MNEEQRLVQERLRVSGTHRKLAMYVKPAAIMVLPAPVFTPGKVRGRPT
jgi:hypothetical protein